MAAHDVLSALRNVQEEWSYLLKHHQELVADIYKKRELIVKQASLIKLKQQHPHPNSFPHNTVKSRSHDDDEESNKENEKRTAAEGTARTDYYDKKQQVPMTMLRTSAESMNISDNALTISDTPTSSSLSSSSSSFSSSLSYRYRRRDEIKQEVAYAKQMLQAQDAQYNQVIHQMESSFEHQNNILKMIRVAMKLSFDDADDESTTTSSSTSPPLQRLSCIETTMLQEVTEAEAKAAEAKRLAELKVRDLAIATSHLTTLQTTTLLSLETQLRKEEEVKAQTSTKSKEAVVEYHKLAKQAEEAKSALQSAIRIAQELEGRVTAARSTLGTLREKINK